MEPVRIACVRYLNTAPLVEGLDKAQGVTLLPSVPSRIIDMLTGGLADIGLASVVDAINAPGPMALIPAGMIGCDGPTLTVRLFSSVPLDQVATLHADTDSHTSVILAQVLLHHLYNVRPPLVPFDARERVELSEQGACVTPGDLHDAWPPTILLIGDKVVTDAPPPERYPHQLDLGEAWKTLTGLPFVYAMWMCPAAFMQDPRLPIAAALLDRQRRHNLTRLDWIVQCRAPEARWPLPLARTYLGENLRYEVTPQAREAVERFLSIAAELNLIARRSVVWA